jgi:arsenate reductase
MQQMKVIFACVHNAGRSQMAAAFFNQFADPAKAQAVSAGTQPADKVHDCVSHAMKLAGIDLANVKPQLLTDELVAGADLLVTMGCGEACPCVPGLKRDDWPLPDPKGKSDSEVCEIRDEIKTRVLTLLQGLNATNCCADSVQVSR